MVAGSAAERTQWAALLIGTSSYPEHSQIRSLPSVDNNLDDLASVLSDPALVGIPRDQVRSVPNPAHRRDVLEPLDELVDDADLDVLFVYYASHGFIDDQDDFYLGLSRTEGGKYDYTALAAEQLTYRLNRALAPVTIFMVDACFSGKLTKSMSGTLDSTVRATFEVDGAITIASSPPNKTSYVNPEERNTAFTGAFLQKIREGRSDIDSQYLTLENVLDATDKALRAAKRPRPAILARDRAGHIAFTRNAAAKAVPRASPPLLNPFLPNVSELKTTPGIPGYEALRTSPHSGVTQLGPALAGRIFVAHDQRPDGSVLGHGIVFSKSGDSCKRQRFVLSKSGYFEGSVKSFSADFTVLGQIRLRQTSSSMQEVLASQSNEQHPEVVLKARYDGPHLELVHEVGTIWRYHMVSERFPAEMYGQWIDKFDNQTSLELRSEGNGFVLRELANGGREFITTGQVSREGWQVSWNILDRGFSDGSSLRLKERLLAPPASSRWLTYRLWSDRLWFCDGHRLWFWRGGNNVRFDRASPEAAEPA